MMSRNNRELYKSFFTGLCFRVLIFLFIVGITVPTLSGCSDDKEEEVVPEPEPEVPDNPDPEGPTVIILDPADIQDYDKIYKPNDFRNIDWLREDAEWSFVRSRQSDHFIVFWQTGFGTDPNASTVPEALRVDIDDLLKKAEIFYEMNIHTLKFANVGSGMSNLDKYKMQIYIRYQTEWLATGGGYDDIIGGLWINPGTCKPVGSTIAHEIGHSFQYQVYADLLASGVCANDFSRGFRYGFGGNGGNGFWEQTAQWQSYQSYPAEAFESYNFTEYINNYFRHVGHEWQRYASYFIHYYWADKHGIDFVGKLWREAVSPEDPMEAYMRMNNLTTDQFNEEMYDAATKFVTWDIDAIRSYGSNYIGKQSYKFYKLSDGSYQVAYSHCPGSTGYNAIPLNVPEAGTIVTTTFEGLQPGSSLASEDPGVCSVNGSNKTVKSYNKGSLTRAGWRYGYVALLGNGQRIYSEMNKKTGMDVEFTIPEGCEKLWFVVLGAPSSYTAHPWDEDESNDDQWPYKVKFTNTNLLGSIDFTGDEDHEDVTFTFDVSFPYSTDTYPGSTVTLSTDDLNKLAGAFVLQPSEITAAMSSKIKFYAVEGTTGALNATTTANGYGHWYNAKGDVCNWGVDGRVYSEFDASGYSFVIGQYPNQCASGDKYTIKQALVYEYEAGKSVQATFVFNITIK
ncbi:MAG: DUF4859 domain-containing protein [Tannerella sp.]|nr:DUF4859 domain-containing protein [Tannerella sp.]